MSMRGEIISREYNRMKFVKDNDGKEFVCYAKDVGEIEDGQSLNEEQKQRCLDSSQILGDTW